MAVRALKNINFVLGFVVGFILTFGSSYIAPIGNLVELIFDGIAAVSPLSELGIIGSIVHAYILTLFVYLLICYVIKKDISTIDVVLRFSLGFISAYLLFFLVGMLAISQFEFTQ